QQVSALARGDGAAVLQPKLLRGNRRGSRQRFSRRQAGLDEQFQLAVQARAVGRAGIGRIRAGEDRRVRGSKLTHSFLGGGVIRCSPRQSWKSPAQLGG